MNFNKFINSDYLKENPLCGIDTYKDELNFATGACTRRIKELVLTGQENWALRAEFTSATAYALNHADDKAVPYSSASLVCSHFEFLASYASETNHIYQDATNFYVTSTDYLTLSDFTTFLQQQYANGTPVTVWYVLATPTTETITVPSGLSGMEEGYLNQSGTPTPTNPIYPTANTVEKWFDINHYIMGTDTDTLTTLPADIYANDTTATVGLKGDMSQTGTPTPTTPIQPSECGERTGNLFDKNWLVEGYTLDFNTGLPSANELRIATTSPVDVSDVSQITISYTVSGFSRNILFIYSILKNGVFVERMAGNSSGDTINIGDADELYLCFYDSRLTPESKITSDNLTNLMVNNGSTALPYEPYGVKIPILLNSQTINKYLGEVQTVRQIKKLVLTGQEPNWNVDSTNLWHLYINDVPATPIEGSPSLYCTHYEGVESKGAYSGLTNGKACIRSSGNYIWIRDSQFANLNEFKAWLAQQYAAGTPVCVWYVLATPQTAVVNEPLRKIGTYADEVSGISIPTITGKDTFDVLTTLKPSEVSLAYTGWHDATVKEWDGSEWQ